MNRKFLVVLAFIVSPAASLLAGTQSVFTGMDASAMIEPALVKSGAGDDITIHMSNLHDENTLATASDTISAEVDNLNVDKEHKSWQATLFFKAAGKNLSPVNVSGTYDEMARIPILKRQVNAGEVITMDDITYDKQPARHLRKNTITNPKDLIGKSPKRVISQGRSIRREEIASPAILLKGTHVTMIFKAGNLEITTLGEALDSGAKGDVIRVRNMASKQIIDGVIETSGRVRVSSPDSSTAEAM